MPSPDPHALRALLRDVVGDGRSAEWRRLAGTRLHDAIARLLDAVRAGTPESALLDPEHGPWLTDASRERLAPVVASPVFARLAALGARTEVPYVAGTGTRVESRAVPGAEVAASGADVDAGRIDALAILQQSSDQTSPPAAGGGAWWVVDWKTTLPSEPDSALAEHRAQLLRYAAVARASGAGDVLVTLVALDHPTDHAWTWRITSDGTFHPASLP